MSAVTPKADMCSALGYVRFVPGADMALQTERPPRGGLSEIFFLGVTQRVLPIFSSCASRADRMRRDRWQREATPRAKVCPRALPQSRQHCRGLGLYRA